LTFTCITNRRCKAPVFAFTAKAAEKVVLEFVGRCRHRDLTMTIAVSAPGRKQVRLTRRQLRRLHRGRITLIATAGTTKATFRFSVRQPAHRRKARGPGSVRGQRQPGPAQPLAATLKFRAG
jgi:hypothetical protein